MFQHQTNQLTSLLRTSIRISLFFICIILLNCCKENDSSTEDNQNTQTNITIPLQQRIETFIARYPMDTTLAIHVFDITANKEVFGYHKDSLMPPASCMKLLTGISALRTFGCRHQFRTQIYAEPTQKKGIVKSLTIRGGFDPLIKPWEIQPLFQCLRKKGINKVDGKVILNLGIQEYMAHEEHWIPGDLKKRNFSFFFLGKDKVAHDIKYMIRAQGTTFQDSQLIWGKLPRKSQFIGSIQTPINDVIYWMWNHSHNEISESLLYSLGSFDRKTDSLRENGKLHLEHFIREELGRTDSCFVIHDGNGMCIHNRLTPTLLTDLLRYAYKHKDIYEMAKKNLPVCGKTGTLIRRMHKPRTLGKIIAKTGTLTRENGISTLSGYFTDENKHLICFSIMNYHVPIADAQLFQDRLCTEFFPKENKTK